MKIPLQPTDSSGMPLAGGRMFFTKQPFADKNRTVQMANPIILDQHGLVPPLYFDPADKTVSISVEDERRRPIWSMNDICIQEDADTP